MGQQQHRETSTFDHDHQHDSQLSSRLHQEQRRRRCGDRIPSLRHSLDEAFERPPPFLCRQHPKTVQGAIAVAATIATPGNNQTAIAAAAEVEQPK